MVASKKKARIYHIGCVFIFFLLLADLIIASECENDIIDPSKGFLVITMLGSQFIIRLMVLAGTVMLTWQTFPAKHGLLGPLLRRFKWFFVTFTLMVFCWFALRGYQLVFIINQNSKAAESPMEFWDPTTRVLYVIQSFGSVVYYVFTIQALHLLASDDLYSPDAFTI